MGGQILGGGVIVLIAVVLWLAYLVPSWVQRRQFDAEIRNAVRLNQALRVLAETSEASEEVRLELTARTATAQQRLAREALAERERGVRGDADAASVRGGGRTRRSSRARRWARLVVTLLGVAAAGLAVWGGFLTVAGGSQIVLWSSVGAFGACVVVLQILAAAKRRGAVKAIAPEVSRAAPTVVDMPDVVLEIDDDPVGWIPRELPRPLSSSSGSRAAAVLDGVAAHEQLRRDELDDAIRERAARNAPPSIAAARAAAIAASSDDAAIEAHVRDLLHRRAVGE